MTDVINSTKMVITQASVVGFHVLEKPSLRQEFQLKKLFPMTNLISFSGNKNDAKLFRSPTNARQHTGNCLTCLYS